MGTISQQNPVRLFVSHVFEPSDDYHRVFEYLESSHNFYYRNCSDPEHKPESREAMKEELRRQIALAEVVIVPVEPLQKELRVDRLSAELREGARQAGDCA